MLKISTLKSTYKPISISHIVKNHFRVLEVISTLNCELEFKIGIGRKDKMSDLKVVALSLTADFISIGSENSLFKQINQEDIPNLIERSQFNKRRKKLFLFSEEIRTKLASHFLDFENYFIVDRMPWKSVNSLVIKELESAKISLKLLRQKDFVHHKTTGFMGKKFMEFVLLQEFFILWTLQKQRFTMYIF